jgi:hypothetical protein
LLVIHPAFHTRRFPEFLALVRDKPGQFIYAPIGQGTPSHLAMETLRRMGSLDLRHVPCKVGGHALARSTATRIPSLPDVPTIAESRLAGFNVFTWAMVYAPPGLPADRAERIRGELGRILARPDVLVRVRSVGATLPDPLCQAQVAAFRHEDVRTWRQLVRERVITPN